MPRRRRRKARRWTETARCLATLLLPPVDKPLRSRYRGQCSAPSSSHRPLAGRRLCSHCKRQHIRCTHRCRLETFPCSWWSPWSVMRSIAPRAAARTATWRHDSGPDHGRQCYGRQASFRTRLHFRSDRCRTEPGWNKTARDPAPVPLPFRVDVPKFDRQAKPMAYQGADDGHLRRWSQAQHGSLGTKARDHVIADAVPSWWFG